MPAAQERPRSFKSLPTFQLELLASLMDSRNELRHQRRFGLRSVECHVLGVVGAQAPISLKDLCQALALDKSHGSRLVAKLVQQGLLDRYDDPVDKRSFYLLLTPAGMTMHAQIYEDATERNAEWLEGLPFEKRALFIECIAQLTTHSQAMLADEQSLSTKPRMIDSPRKAGQDTQALILIERAKLEKLHEQLGAILSPAAK